MHKRHSRQIQIVSIIIINLHFSLICCVFVYPLSFRWFPFYFFFFRCDSSSVNNHLWNHIDTYVPCILINISFGLCLMCRYCWSQQLECNHSNDKQKANVCAYGGNCTDYWCEIHNLRFFFFAFSNASHDEKLWKIMIIGFRLWR